MTIILADIEKEELDSRFDTLINENFDGEIKKIKKKRPLSEHKYLKQVFLLLVFFSIFVMASFLFSLIIPGFFLEYVKFKFPNLKIEEQQSKASFYKSFSDSLPFISVFLFGPVVGVISDKYGRKPIFYGTCVFLGADLIALLISIKTNNLWCYYVVHTITGVSSVASAAVFSFVSDISDEDHVPIIYSLVGVATGFGVVFGPLSFVLISKSDITNLAIYVLMGMVLICSIIVPFLSESIEIAKLNGRIKPNEQSTSSNPFKVVKALFSGSGYLTWIIILYTSLSYASTDVLGLFYYYCGLEYNWGSTENGLFMCGLGIMIMIWGALFIPFLLRFYSGRRIITIGFFINVLSHVLFVFSNYSKYIFIAGGILGCISPNLITLIQSEVSSATPPHLLATVMSGVLSIGSIASFVGSIAVNNIYMYSISEDSPFFYPQAAFLVNGVVVVITAVGSIFIWRYYKNQLPLSQQEVKVHDKNGGYDLISNEL